MVTHVKIACAVSACIRGPMQHGIWQHCGAYSFGVRRVCAKQHQEELLLSLIAQLLQSEGVSESGCSYIAVVSHDLCNSNSFKPNQ